MDLQIEYFTDGTGFCEIDPLSINPEYLADFSIYERQPLSDGQFRFRCLLVNPCSLEKHRLIELLRFWKKVYIHEKQANNYQEYIKNNLAYILMHDEIEISKKTNTLIDISIDVVAKYFETNFANAGDVKKSLGDVQKLITQAIAFISDINSLNGIVQLIGHDYQTHTHSIKVGWLMATFVNFNKDLFIEEYGGNFKEFLIQAAVAGLLHDIGKVKVPKNILGKKGKLDNLEYIVVQCHTAYSASLLFDSGLSRATMQAILYHHENEDGSGYPSGLKQDQIPMISKVCHIVDVFDALTSKRHYKASKTPIEALRIMTGENPYIETLNKFEQEARENRRTPVTAIVRDDYDTKLRRLREKQMVEEEAKKRVEARTRLRDQGMSHCFDRELLQRFIFTINQSQGFDLSEFL
ncbi:MAG: HD domain-containing protein [Desulfobacula sp.]|nr:HD domain-containing protein [Desulfobacula sp.]